MNVWWCEEHRASGKDNRYCEAVDRYRTSCRLVPMRLVPADALVVEKVDGAWPKWAASQSAFRTQIMGDGYPSLFPRTMAEILDVLVQASQVGESGR